MPFESSSIVSPASHEPILDAPGASEPLERYDPSAHNPFESLGVQFLVERRPEAMLHKAIRRDLSGRVVVEVAAEIAFVLGSGTRGRSYLLNRDGYLFQSPLSWYTQKSAWDLSPGFALLPPGAAG